MYCLLCNFALSPTPLRMAMRTFTNQHLLDLDDSWRKRLLALCICMVYDTPSHGKFRHPRYLSPSDD